MPLAIPNDIQNETPADAVEVDQNYKTIQAYVNANAVIRDGTVAMQAPLHLFGDPINDDDAVRKAYVDAILPIGIILPYAGSVVPAGAWAACNGAAVQTSIYPKLFQVISYNFGGSGGSFNLPDLRARIIITRDTREARFNTPGDKGGTWQAPVQQHRHHMNHNHPAADTGGQSQSHTHGMAHTHPVNIVSETQNANHHHDGGQGGYDFIVARSDGNFNLGTAATKVGMSAQSATADATHAHRVQGVTGGVTGTSDRTGEAGQGHTHVFNVPFYDGDTAYAGTDNAEHLPPYLVLLHLIRVG